MRESSRVHHQSLGGSFFARPQIHRRAMFRHLASAVGGYFLLPAIPPLRAQGTGTGVVDNVIFVLLSGGISQTDTFDLKPGPWTPADFGPEQSDGVLWPTGLLPRLAGQLPQIALVRSVEAWAADHGLARQWLQIGRNPARPDSLASPHIGSVIASELAAGDPSAVLPAYISLNAVAGNQPGAGFLPAAYAPFLIGEVDGAAPDQMTHPDGRARYDARVALLEAMAAGVEPEQDQGRVFEEVAANAGSARRLTHDARVESAFTLGAAERDQYGNSPFGDACLVARNLLRDRLGPRFIQITFGDWDHHGQIYSSRALSAEQPDSMGRRLDAGLGSLIADLEHEGLLARTLVFAMGEFGRTTGPLTAAAGRDHLRNQAVLFAGGSIRGGRAIGSTDPTGSVITESGWSQDRQVRHEDLEATLYWALGIDWTKSVENPATGGRYLYVPGSDVQAYAPLTELWDGPTRRPVVTRSGSPGDQGSEQRRR